MWISWSNTDPIMDKLHLIPKALPREHYRSTYVDYSLITGSLYAGYVVEDNRVVISTYRQFQQIMVLQKLGMPFYEIQQQLRLGTTDDT